MTFPTAPSGVACFSLKGQTAPVLGFTPRDCAGITQPPGKQSACGVAVTQHNFVPQQVPGSRLLFLDAHTSHVSIKTKFSLPWQENPVRCCSRLLKLQNPSWLWGPYLPHGNPTLAQAP